MALVAAVRLACVCIPLTVSAAVPAIEVANPRCFGYVVGDTLERQIVVTVPRTVIFQPGSLPKIGERTAWLTLIEADVAPKGWLGDHRYEFRLRYQVINAPTEVRHIDVPAVRLRFKDGAQTLDVPVDSASVTLAPIIASGVRAEATPLRPDLVPRPMSASSVLTSLTLCVGLATAMLMYRVSTPLRKRRNGPFAQAHRTIRQIATRADRVQAYQDSLRALHRAFDETARRRVFLDGLDAFTAEQPQFADLREVIDQFLRLSRREFFGSAVPAEERSIDWLLSFCRECRARERRAT